MITRYVRAYSQGAPFWAVDEGGIFRVLNAAPWKGGVPTGHVPTGIHRRHSFSFSGSRSQLQAASGSVSPADVTANTIAICAALLIWNRAYSSLTGGATTDSVLDATFSSTCRSSQNGPFNQPL